MRLTELNPGLLAGSSKFKVPGSRFQVLTFGSARSPRPASFRADASRGLEKLAPPNAEFGIRNSELNSALRTPHSALTGPAALRGPDNFQDECDGSVWGGLKAAAWIIVAMVGGAGAWMLWVDYCTWLLVKGLR